MLGNVASLVGVSAVLQTSMSIFALVTSPRLPSSAWVNRALSVTLVAVVGTTISPVYSSVASSRPMVKGFESEDGVNWPVIPPNEAVSVYGEPGGKSSCGLFVVAVPELSVVALAVSVPIANVTGAEGIGLSDASSVTNAVRV